MLVKLSRILKLEDIDSVTEHVLRLLSAIPFVNGHLFGKILGIGLGDDFVMHCRLFGLTKKLWLSVSKRFCLLLIWIFVHIINFGYSCDYFISNLLLWLIFAVIKRYRCSWRHILPVVIWIRSRKPFSLGRLCWNCRLSLICLLIERTLVPYIINLNWFLVRHRWIMTLLFLT